MFRRFSPAITILGGSVVVLAVLVAALYALRDNRGQGHGGEPLEVYCAETLRESLTAIAAEYEAEYGQRVLLHPGPSQTILVNLELNKKGDLFIPADESFIELARKKNLITTVEDVARMNPVVIVRRDYGKEIASWEDFIAPGVRVCIANTESTAIGKILKRELTASKRWDGVAARVTTYAGNISEVRNNVVLGTVDAGIVWDMIAEQVKDKVKIVHLPELDKAGALAQMALANSSQQPLAARRFARFIRAKDKGAVHLTKAGFTKVHEGYGMEERPELVVYAGSMLRPALEKSLVEFEEREHVKIVRVYNGCGILVSQMKTGDQGLPDVYFACDTSFMKEVQPHFSDPTNVSNNQIMIVVKKGNPHGVKKLLDLAKPGLRVGVGHEHQCALGALTKETFIRTGTYAKIMKNIVEQAPTGDLLINQLRVGSLDAVLAYRTNMHGFENELEGTPITGVPCATPSQPIAVSKNSTHPQLSKHLMEYLSTVQSRGRFEEIGFGWELKEVK